MAGQTSSRKRKDTYVEDASEDEIGDELEGILSQSEDEDEDHAEFSGDEDGFGIADHSSNVSEDRSEIGSDDETFDKPFRVVEDANGNERYVYEDIDPVYDSDDTDAQGPANTIGNIPLSFYDSYPHIGYDINGKKIMRPATGEALDALLDSIELPKGWTGLTDPETGKPLNLSQDELELLKKIQMNEVPEEGYDPYAVSNSEAGDPESANTDCT